MINGTVPLVSVLCITFNHEKFISQAIEGFLLQETDFKVEIIIHDDASTDGTAEIIRSYAQRYPEIITAILQTENQYSKRDGSLESIIYAACHGRYIAFCEGDDYWTDGSKLQQQVDFLESHSDVGLVHHDADYLFENTGEVIREHHKVNNTLISNGHVYKELIRNNNIYSPTVMFRNDLIRSYLEIDVITRGSFLMGDYVMWLAFSQHCNFHYMPKSMATYRVLENSASKSTSYDKALAFVNSYFDIRLYFLSLYPIKELSVKVVEDWRTSMCISTSIKYRKDKEARRYARQLNFYSLRSLFKKVLVIFPGLFRYIQRKNKL